MKPTDKPPQSQGQNGFGRIPDELLPKLKKLPHTAGHVFAMLCILANRTPRRGPLGAIQMSKSRLAAELKLERRSLYRALDALQGCGMVTQDPTSGCVMVTHYLCHDDSKVSHGDTKGVSSCLTPSEYPQENVEDTATSIRSRRVYEGDVIGKQPKKPASTKKKSKKRESWLYWDKEQDRLRRRPGREEDEKRFRDRWLKELSEEVFEREIAKANAWLREGERWREKKNLSQFFNNWLIKRLDD